MQKKLFIISNERFYSGQKNFYCDNIAEKTLPDGLSKNFEIEIVGRVSSVKRAHKLNLKKIITTNNLISYLIYIYKNIRKDDAKFLVLSISPYTFLASLIFIFSNSKPFVYLRSDGHEEYKSILGFYGPFLYSIMFNIVSKIGVFISCREYILKKKRGYIVYPSEINSKWILNQKKLTFDVINLLYVGRIKVEKGIFSLLKMINNQDKINLTILGATKDNIKKINQNNVKVFEIENEENNIIKFYDDHNIFILPSYTEGHPMVLLESLARLRPVIVFKEIKHVIGDYEGIFISQRNTEELIKNINHIKENYEEIQERMKKNKLPTKETFLNDFVKLLS